MSGYKLWADDEVLAHFDINGLLMAQVVPRFASTVARSAAIGTPAEGQLCWVAGTGYQQYDGTAWVALLPAGLPDGGTTGQVLVKLSGADYDVGWVTP